MNCKIWYKTTKQNSFFGVLRQFRSDVHSCPFKANEIQSLDFINVFKLYKVSNLNLHCLCP